MIKMLAMGSLEKRQKALKHYKSVIFVLERKQIMINGGD